MSNPEAIKAAKEAIIQSPNVENDLCRKFLLWAVDKTNGFKDELLIDIGSAYSPKDSFARMAANSVHDIVSSGGTDINSILEQHGIDMCMHACNVTSLEDGKTTDFSLWFVREMSNAKDAPVIPVDMVAVQDTRLEL